MWTVISGIGYDQSLDQSGTGMKFYEVKNKACDSLFDYSDRAGFSGRNCFHGIFQISDEYY
jgi:hypothetical protein